MAAEGNANKSRKVEIHFTTSRKKTIHDFLYSTATCSGPTVNWNGDPGMSSALCLTLTV